MPKIALQIQAQMENVTNLNPDGEDFRWYLKLTCENCGEETSDFVYCTLTVLILALKGFKTVIDLASNSFQIQSMLSHMHMYTKQNFSRGLAHVSNPVCKDGNHHLVTALAKLKLRSAAIKTPIQRCFNVRKLTDTGVGSTFTVQVKNRFQVLQDLAKKYAAAQSEHNMGTDILKDSLAAYTADDVGKFKTIVKFDSRGVSPTEFSPRVGWTAEGLESGTPFSIDLGEKEWFDYDEKAGESVSITEFQYQFVHVKH